jgi:hypothetical protein
VSLAEHSANFKDSVLFSSSTETVFTGTLVFEVTGNEVIFFFREILAEL